MIHPLLLDLARHPGLALEHASAYAELASVQAQAWGRQVRQRALVALGALLMGVMALGLAGASALLLATTPLAAMPHPWLLWAVPALPLTVGLALAGWLWHTPLPAAFDTLREQLSIDLATLRLLDQERHPDRPTP